MPPDFTCDHRDRISGKTHVLRQIKAVDSLDQTDTADLKKIVSGFSAACEPLDDGEDKPQIRVNETLPRFRIAFFDALQKCMHLIRFQTRQS